MNALLVNTYDWGGAANACIRLHQALLLHGFDTKLLLKTKRSHTLEHAVAFSSPLPSYSFQEKLAGKTKNILKELKLYKEKTAPKDLFLEHRDKALEMFSYPTSDCNILSSEQYQQADIINLHWVAKFLDYESFFVQNTKPVVWTLHDQSAFLGGEHYNEKYIGIDEKGFPKARKLSNKEKAKSQEILDFKIRLFSRVKNLTVVCPSQWLSSEAKNSEVLGAFPVHTIPYSLPENIFKPRDKQFSRNLFDIPTNKTVILFVAANTQNKRKGFEFLLRALEKLRAPDILLVSVGQKGKLSPNQHNVLELGNIADERLMSLVYSAADVFVIPSLMDNLPNTTLESIACGTPVIGFPVGGITDTIIDEKNGLLTPNISVDALVDTLLKFIKNKHEFKPESIRKDAVSRYATAIQASNYIKLYQQVYDQQ